jgi:hypothetical protein
LCAEITFPRFVICTTALDALRNERVFASALLYVVYGNVWRAKSPLARALHYTQMFLGNANFSQVLIRKGV